ncbi:SDR family NAD(P)-dependent oxidoreductase [Zhongshania aliphaticivorans]|uniref:SDR family NAD(P)-dependent oxidoreductase n=1 Tax=Zhongshania aliphaticivorans TaxID=1470434 RepID=UPI0012E4BBC8|nr:SDR family oxidoreductase [Zhongshania aliphaticivorans]CAA0112662.1 2-dehydro-3-deoxy-D-gluconate 5-dehydrogenase [Zhongshania aliphaticivorans]
MSYLENMFSNKGRVALVTGSGTGMGVSFAKALAKSGATVICAARRLDKVEQVAKEINEAGGKAVAYALDIGNTESVKQVFDQAYEAFGVVDILVNNAGQIQFKPFPDVEDEEWGNLLNVNLTGTMRMAREFSKRLLPLDVPGSIVNITSITGIQTLKNVPCYGSVKAALNQLTKQIAADMFDTKIRCNAIAPGYFMTEMVDWYFETEQGQAEVARLPSKRIGNVEELAGTLLLLTSQASSFVNGVIIPVDYGHNILLA